MPSLEFVSQSTRDSDNISASTERLVNLYPEPLPDGARARFSLKSVLGTEAWAETPGVFVRALKVVGSDGQTFGAIGGSLYEFSSDGSHFVRGSITDDAKTSIAGNNGDVTVAAAGSYYVWDGTTLSTPTAGAFSSFGSVEFIGNYTVLTELNGRRFQWSDLADASTLPGLNFATAESTDDALLRAVAINGNLWLFKESSIEIWALTGQSGANAFARLGGGTLDTGLADYGLITKFPGGAFFVGNDGIAYITSGAQLQPVSIVSVETALEDGTPTNCFYYEDEGHKFCVIRFSDRPAWVYDIVTGLWHERASGSSAWDATASVKAFGSWRVGQSGGNIGRLVRNNADIGQAIIRQATSRTLYIEGRRFRVPMVEFLGRVGKSNLGRDAEVMVEFSRDGGQTWGNEIWRSMGSQGEYEARMVLRNVGQARNLSARLTLSDEADLTLYSRANVVTA